MNIYVPEAIKKINKILFSAGFQCYLVGGAIRNQILKKEAKDYDLTTNAKPEEVMELFKKVIPTGIKHGTVTIIMDNSSYEITTYRIDGKYSDGRRPDKIEFTPSIEEDLMRRDFTINSIAYNIQTQTILDINNGIEDIELKRIKAIGDPVKRFEEDALRLVRACRFSSQLNFSIEQSTYDGIKKSLKKLPDVSKERIADELEKILVSSKPSIAFNHFYKTGMLEVLFPMLFYIASNSHELFLETINDLDNIETDNTYVKMARLIYLLPQKDQLVFLKDLKLSNKYIYSALHISKFVSLSPFDYKKGYSIRKFLSELGLEYLADIYALLEGMKRVTSSEMSYFIQIAENELEQGNPLFLKDLNINGTQLIKYGVKPGPEIGKTLNYLLEKVLLKPEINEFNELLLQIKNS